MVYFSEWSIPYSRIYYLHYWCSGQISGPVPWWPPPSASVSSLYYALNDETDEADLAYHTVTAILDVTWVTNNTNKYASYPDWRISPHANRRHHQRWPVCHTGLATARPVCCTWLTTVRRIINFSLFGLGRANPWAKVHQKGRWTGSLLDLPSYKISSP